MSDPEWQADMMLALPAPDFDIDRSKEGFFRHHRCWSCNDVAEDCVVDNPHRCEYPRARNE